MPWWGITWLNHPDWPRWIGRVLQNADTFGSLLALGLLWWALHRSGRAHAGRTTERGNRSPGRAARRQVRSGGHDEVARMRVAVLDDYADAFRTLACARGWGTTRSWRSPTR